MPGAQTPTTTTQPPADTDSFDAVFAEITGEPNDEPTTTPAAQDGKQHASDNAEQPDESPDGGGDPAESAGAVADPAAEDGKGEQTPAGDNAGAGEPIGQSSIDYAAQIAALHEQFAAMQAAQAPAQAQPQPQPEPEPEIYTKAEAAELETLQADWPDLKRLFELMSRQTEANVVKYTFSEIGKVLAPLQQSVGVLTGNEHMDAIYAAHADYDALYAPCMEWVEKQPSFLKAAYQNVVKQGTAEEVATLIQRFKDETKWQAPAGSSAVGGSRPAPQAAPQKSQSKPAELSAAAMKAAQTIGAVGTKRGAIPASQDPSDFDGAWAEANADSKQ